MTCTANPLAQEAIKKVILTFDNIVDFYPWRLAELVSRRCLL